MKITENSPLIKDHRPYVLWRRSPIKSKNELDLEVQLAIAREFTKRGPAKIFTDEYTGTDLRECENLWKAVDYCVQKGYRLIIAKADRFHKIDEAIEVLHTVGEGNLSFCDLPIVNEQNLSVLFNVIESHNIMGKISTKVALDNRRDQIDENGGWYSKSGNWCKRLGNDKGCDMTKAHAAAHAMVSAKHQEWMKTSPAFQFVRQQINLGRPRKEIIEECHKMGLTSRSGMPLTAAILSHWVKLMGEQ